MSSCCARRSEELVCALVIAGSVVSSSGMEGGGALRGGHAVPVGLGERGRLGVARLPRGHGAEVLGRVDSDVGGGLRSGSGLRSECNFAKPVSLLKKFHNNYKSRKLFLINMQYKCIELYL